MEDDSLQRCSHLGSARYPVKGMESVVATVSGYHGSERFNLIKLIDRTGASYVGNMSPSITHLVCWRFEGRKYDIAMRLKIPVVNHCWIEECAKKGGRVSEEPYTYRSGEEMGPLVLDILLDIDQAKARPKDLKNGKRPLLDPELEDSNDAVWEVDSILLDEDLFRKKRQNAHDSRRSTEKANKINSSKGCPRSGRHELPKLSTAKIVELDVDEASTSRAAYSSRQDKRNSESPVYRPKCRRLVKRHMSSNWLITSDEEDECEEVKVLPVNKSHEILVDSSQAEMHQTSSRHISNIGCTLDDLGNSDARDTFQEIEYLDDDDIDELEYPNHETLNSHARNAPSSSATSEKLHEAANPDSTKEDSLPPASNESSCIICLSDFSSTRGVLLCGHRFCFECIQHWADTLRSSGKPATCPLCITIFTSINKVEDAVSSDQKIYSQSMPNDSLKTSLYVLPDETHIHPTINQSAPVCDICSGREPVDILVSCDRCSTRCVHSWCLDPLLLPWTCRRCKDLQMLYLR